MTTTRKGRGPSTASKQASAYLAKHPSTPAKDLAKKFKIDTSTIYRSAWWQQRGQGTQQGAK